MIGGIRGREGFSSWDKQSSVPLFRICLQVALETSCDGWYVSISLLGLSSNFYNVNT